MARFFEPIYSDSAIDLDEVCFVGPIKFNSHSSASFDVVLRTSGKSISVEFTGQMPTITSQARKCRDVLINNLLNAP